MLTLIVGALITCPPTLPPPAHEVLPSYLPACLRLGPPLQ